jgi:hypothetical protein
MLSKLKFLLILLLPALCSAQGIGGKASVGGKSGFGGGSAAAALARVEVVAGTCSGGSGGTCSVTFGTATTSGELIVCDWQEGSNNNNPASFTDNKSQSYTPKGGATFGGFNLGFYELSNSTSGVTTVTMTTNAADNAGLYGGLICGHYTGTAVSSFDQAGAFTSSATPWSSPTVTTTVANEVLVGGNFAFSNLTQAATGSWTLRAQWNDGNGDSFIYEDQIVSVIQTNIGATGTSGTNSNSAGIVTFH